MFDRSPVFIATMVTEQTARGGVGFRSERGPVLAAVMLSTALVAIDATILATAVPSIVSDLGGFAQFPWLFSIYLLAQAVSVPIYGKFADLVGRKPVMLVGVATFVIGSVLCGLAWSMPALIAFRVVQGLGAGAVLPMSMTIVGDIYSVAERARVQGYLSSVWGISSVVGPTLGGVFSDYLSWRWIFFINIPVGAAAAVMLIRRFTEQVVRRKHQIDYAGAALLAVGCTLLILGLLEGGVLWPWTSPESIAVLVTAAVLLAAFGLVERRAAEPVLPLWVLRHRLLVGSSLASLTVGVLMIGLTSYVPVYAQGVLGTGAVVAGFAVATMSMGWPLASAISGRFYMRIGFRNTGLLGSLSLAAGLALLLPVAADSSPVHLAVACFVVGTGLGFIAAPTLIAAQSVVPWESRGVVTGTNMFARSVGSAVGVAVFGAIANASVSASPSTGGDVGHLARGVLAPAIHNVFVGAALFGVLMLVALGMIPRRVRTL